MKKTIRTYLSGITAVLFSVVFIASCEDVVDVDLPTEEPRLIIDALIRVDTSKVFTDVVVKVAETGSFFGTVPPAELQQITITNSETGVGEVLIEQEPGTGIYRNPDPFPTAELLESEWLLQIDYEDQIYFAYAQFTPSVPIDSAVQGDGILFDEDDTEVIIAFTDSGERDDFYLFDFDFANYLVTKDEFYQGQLFEFSYYYDDLLVAGDTVNISLMGVDEDFYNYMDQLITQSEEGFGPFETPSLTVRGNIINATDMDNNNNFNNLNNTDNFALGYFAIVQEFKETVIIEDRAP
ncbi:MAG: DUF4249 domain-containing protein [Bacteroidia bacterium]|nr:DUF4249 domain-containing protein [Bacteroidia bacterium]NNF30244.1 DUF4249 family protein [Flavobacteriaceae bacterium]MBT8277315.1 DUF4249 domain-containing protein [Bacteroidia bacterium]NNJ81628.1 DUF4249 family protein [Flavobacteriaceae bacterium]NNK54251.1 DUF4249 family protein [Flavobacteriaceae bacterium]